MARYKLAGLPVLGESVQMGDVYAGAAVGTLALPVLNLLDSYTAPKDGVGLLQKHLWTTTKDDKTVPGMLAPAKPLVAAGLLGALVWFAQKSKNPSRAKGHVAGIVGVGLAKTFQSLLSTYLYDKDKSDSFMSQFFQPTAGVPSTSAIPYGFNAPQAYVGPSVTPYMGANVSTAQLPALGATVNSGSIYAVDNSTLNIAKARAAMAGASGVDGEIF